MKIANKKLKIRNVNIGDHSVLRYLEIGCYFSVISVAKVELQVV